MRERGRERAIEIKRGTEIVKIDMGKECMFVCVREREKE